MGGVERFVVLHRVLVQHARKAMVVDGGGVRVVGERAAEPFSQSFGANGEGWVSRVVPRCLEEVKPQ